MESTTSDAHTHVEPGPSTAAPEGTARTLRIRWDRTFIALVGLIALLMAGITGALSVFNLGSPGVGWTSLLVFAAVVVGLRAMAVRDHSVRRAERQAARATANATAQESSSNPVEKKETSVFDGAQGAAPAPVPKPLTSEELRAAAMRVAAKGTADAKLAHTQTLAEGELEAETWEPVAVPVPGYVTANRALSLEKPLVLPDVPKSAGTSIRADQAGVGIAGEHGGVVTVVQGDALDDRQDAEIAKTDKSSRTEKFVPASERGTHALNNLDDVLQRRRA
ncbi:hypothetical protein AAFM46_13495 [Arthrobacter sp. TMP15]|uniref:hypothetical protein n=1 Tax=Arthrobacter sp. TMP15 TaxID=3140789 RepID=UPI0031B9FC60